MAYPEDNDLNDNLTPAVAAVQQKRQGQGRDARMNALLQNQSVFEQQAGVKEAAQAAPLPVNSDKPAKAEGGGLWNNVKEIPGAVVGGLRDAAQNTMSAIDDSAHWLDDNLIDLRASRFILSLKTEKDAKPVLPQVGEQQTMTGKLVRGLTEFTAGFIPAVKGLRALRGGAALTTVGKVAESAVATGAAAAVVLDPQEKRVSNMITELNPDLKNPVLDYLSADPSDSNATGRFKNALENIGLGLGVDAAVQAVRGLYLGVKAVKAHFNGQGKDAGQAVTEIAGASAPTAASEGRVMGDKLIDEFKAKLAKTEGQLTLEDSLEQLGVVVPKSSAMSEAQVATRQAIIDEANTVVTKAEAERAAEDSPARLNQTATKETGLTEPGKALDLPAADVTPQAGRILLPESVGGGARNPLGASQGGAISPDFLIDTLRGAFGATPGQVAGSVVGGVAGYNAGDKDATLGDKLGLAALGAFGGRVAAKLVSHPAVVEHVAAEAKAAREPVEKVMATASARNIAPEGIAAKIKPSVRFNQGRSDSLVKSLQTGDFKQAVADVGKDFNFDHIDTADEAKQFINETSAVLEREIERAAGGTQTFGSIEKLASEIGAGADSLRELYKDTSNLSARITAHRMMLAASAETVTKMAKGVRELDVQALTLAERESAQDAALLSLRKQTMLHATIQAQLKGVQTETARALSAMRIQSSSDKYVANEMSDLINSLGGKKLNMEFADKIASLKGDALNKFVRKGAMVRTQDALFEYWVNALLSSPVTHAANIIGNSLVAVGSIAEKSIASLVGLARRNPERIELNEAIAQTWGMAEGLIDSLRVTETGRTAALEATGKAVRGDFAGAKSTLADNAGEFGGAYRSFVTDAPVIDNAAFGTKQFGLQTPAISGEGLGIQPGALGTAADVLGTLARTPGRFLTAEDEVFKTLNFRGSMKAQAYRAARSEGLSGDALTKRISDLVETPTAEMSQQAIKDMREMTFTNPLGEAGSAVQYAIARVPGARYLMPFVRTPSNIMKYTFDRTPGLNMLAQSNRAEWAAGGTRRDMIIAKMSTGGALYGAAAYLAAQGNIVGGGVYDPNKSAESIGGQQPYSVKVGDKYYSFNRVDPLGAFLGLAADFSEISGHLSQGDADNLGGAMVTALAKNVLSKSYLSGLTQAIVALADSNSSKGERWVQQFAGSFVPAGVAQSAKVLDPETKEVYNLMDSLKKRIPGFTKDLFPQRNLLTGEPVRYKAGLGNDIASPIYTSEAAADPAAKEIARLNVDVKHPPKAIGNVPLEPHEYDKLLLNLTQNVKLNGQNMREFMNTQVNDPKWQHMSEGQDVYEGGKEHTLKYIFSTFQSAAKDKLIAETPALKARVLQDMRNTGNAITGNNPVAPLPEVAHPSKRHTASPLAQ